MRPRIVFAARARAESGFTLIEVLMVSLLLAVVLVPVLNSLDFTNKQTPVNVEYANAISSATTGLQKMMQEIRQAYEINATNGDPNTGVGSSIDFFAVVNDQNLEIEYDCNQPYPGNANYHRCLRVAVAKGTALPAISTGAVAIDRVLNPNALTFYGAGGTADPIHVIYVHADVQVPARGALSYGPAHTITLDNGTSIPNLQDGGS